MNKSALPGLIVIGCLAAAAPIGLATAQDKVAETPFSADVKALPFPPDAREVEFDATFKDVEFVSGSQLAALAQFYRREMTARGWKEDPAKASSEEEEIELTFHHGEAEVVVELEVDEEEVDVSLDCEGLTWEDVDNPAALLKAGVPQPRSHLLLQKELPRPKDANQIEYEDDTCKFKCSLDFVAAAAYYSQALTKLGWREDVSKRFLGKFGHRRNYRRGPATLIVFAKKNHQEPGSRIDVEYQSTQKEVAARPLPAVGALAGNSGAPGSAPDNPAAEPKKTVRVADNKGSATVTLGPQKWTFKNVAAFQSKQYVDRTTAMVFSNRPIPLAKLQRALQTNDDFTFGELYEFELPSFIVIFLSEDSVSLSFTADGIGIGRGAEHVERKIQVGEGRVSGTLKVTEPEIVFDKPFSFVASIDAGLMRHDTRIGGSAGSPAPSAADSPFRYERDAPVPKVANDVQSVRSQYRQQVTAAVKMNIAELVELYRKELPAQKWREVTSAAEVEADAATLVFKRPTGTLTVEMTRDGAETRLQVGATNATAAKRDGILPEPGKARLVMGNAYDRDIVITIGKTNYPIKSGRGARDPKTALNYTIGAGRYVLTIQIPGQPAKTETLDITEGTAWGVLALPTGGYMAEQLY